MVISFMVEEARKQLEEKDVVYTLRPTMRKRVGYDWYNHFRTDTKKGDVKIEYINNFLGYESMLKYYVRFSGFSSLEEWLEKAGKSRYLYRVILLKRK